MPVYDARQRRIDFESDFERLDQVFPRLSQELPENSIALVAYTLTSFKKDKPYWQALFNIQWAMLLENWQEFSG